MTRRIKRAKIHTIALCKRGANRLPGIYKAEGEGLLFEALIVKDDRLLGEGLLTSVVYAPEMRDSQGDIASAAVIKDMAHGFFREGGELNLSHDGKPISKKDAYPAESFVIQKGDPRFANATDRDGNSVDVAGGWGVVIKLESEELRKKYASGEWDGVSMEGSGEFEASTAKTDDFLNALAKRLGLNTTEEIDMDPKELVALIKSEIATALSAALKKEETGADGLDPIAKSLFPNDDTKAKVAHAAIQLAKAEGKGGDALVKAATDATAEPEADAKAAPVFKGDPSDAKAVAEHAEALRVFKASEEVDWNDPEAVAAFAKSMEKSEDAEGDDGLTEADKHAGIEKSDNDEVRTLKRQLFKADSRSNQDAADSGDRGGEWSGSGLTKSEQKVAKNGDKMAGWLNQQRGYSES